MKWIVVGDFHNGQYIMQSSVGHMPVVLACWRLLQYNCVKNSSAQNETLISWPDLKARQPSIYYNDLAHYLHCICSILKANCVWSTLETRTNISINNFSAFILSCFDCPVYLRATPEVCYERLRKRDRKEETTIPFVSKFTASRHLLLFI